MSFEKRNYNVQLTILVSPDFILEVPVLKLDGIACFTDEPAGEIAFCPSALSVPLGKCNLERCGGEVVTHARSVYIKTGETVFPGLVNIAYNRVAGNPEFERLGAGRIRCKVKAGAESGTAAEILRKVGGVVKGRFNPI